MRFIIFLIIFYSISLSSQTDSLNEIIVKEFEDSVYVTSNKNIASYYEHVSAAELLIIDSFYEEALSLYNKAFLYKNPGFIIDLRNYKELANVLNKKETYFQIDSLLKLFDSIPPNFKNKINIEQSRDFYIGLLDEDQKDRTEKYKKVDYIYQGESGNYIRYRDSLRYLKFIDKVLKDGFPSEFEIGIHNRLEPNTILEVLFRHWRAWNFDINGIILKAVKDGKLRSTIAADLIDKGDIFGLHLAYEYNDELINYYYKLKVGTIKQYDENRNKFYLDSYFKQVIKYEFDKYTDSKFDFGTLIYSFAIFN